MTNSSRLPKPFGQFIDRSQTLAFRFEGKKIHALQGDTIASALAANGQWLISRSFKYHRPRGPLTMAGQDANTLVQLPGNPNVLADKLAAEAGMRVSAQNVIGSLAKDRSRWLDKLAKFMPVGFYYKAFYKPRGIWEKWAPLIRAKAGLGKIDPQHQPAYFDKEYLFYDLVVVGGGPAGLSAGLAAADAGAKVLLVDENPHLGGALNYARLTLADKDRVELRETLIEKVTAHDNIHIKTDALCNGWFADNWLPVIQGNRLHKVRAKQMILCVGVLEQQAVFRNNDLPGVMMSSGVARLMHLYGVKPGKTAVILTGNNEGYALALDLKQAGVEVKRIVDLRDRPVYNEVAQAACAAGLPISLGYAVYAAHADSTANHLGSVELRKVIDQGKCDQKSEFLDCELLAMSVGYTPAYQLACQAGAQLSYDDDSGMFTLDNLPDTLHIAGSVTGIWDLHAVMQDGKRVALMACNALGLTEQAIAASVTDNTLGSPNYPWPIFAHPKGKEFVDFDEDLQIEDIINATRDGYDHIQLVKRYSTCGMGPSQGRHSALASARLVALATNNTVAQTGVTTSRPPFAAELIGHNAGRSFYPVRRSAMHYRHLQAGAQMMQAGAWYRTAYYGEPADRQSCIHREVDNVRNNVGLVDVSTLGGIEVRGADAGEFLNRFYTFGFVKQQVGKARYALLTNEAGVVIDDGVSCRFHEHHYYVTATTGGVDRVYQQMLKWNAQWRLQVDIANVTSAYSGVNIAGPQSRQVLQKLCKDIVLSAENFPYMGVREGQVAGIPARVIRVGFVGELGFEIHVPQQYGEALWDALMQAGQSVNIQPFGIEAQRVLRLEKGHIIIGQDTDAMSNPMEILMTWAISRKKPFFVGGRTIQELEKTPLSRVLAGFIVQDPKAPIPLESHLVIEGDKMTGRVTSCNYSPTLGKAIGMAYVLPEQAKPGNTVRIKSSGGVLVDAQIVDLPFYDPDNSRQAL